MILAAAFDVFVAFVSGDGLSFCLLGDSTDRDKTSICRRLPPSNLSVDVHFIILSLDSLHRGASVCGNVVLIQCLCWMLWG